MGSAIAAITSENRIDAGKPMPAVPPAAANTSPPRAIAVAPPTDSMLLSAELLNPWSAGAE